VFLVVRDTLSFLIHIPFYLFFGGALIDKRGCSFLMDFDVVTAVETDYLRITAKGNYSLASVFSFLDRVKSEAERATRKRVLIDSRDIQGNMTEADRFFAGRKLAEAFGSRLKAAVLMPGYKITKLGEAVAVSRGAKVLVTDSEQEALTWLLSQE
jgi:hypothetical protein